MSDIDNRLARARTSPVYWEERVALLEDERNRLYAQVAGLEAERDRMRCALSHIENMPYQRKAARAHARAALGKP